MSALNRPLAGGSGRFTVAYGVIRNPDPSIRDLTGFAGEEIQGSNGAAFIHPYDRPQYVNALQTAITEGFAATEVRVINRTGRVTPCSLHISQPDRDSREVEVSLRWDDPTPPGEGDHNTSSAAPPFQPLPDALLEAGRPDRHGPADYFEIDARARLVRVEATGDVPWQYWQPGDELRELGSRLPDASRAAIERAARQRQQTTTAFYDEVLQRAFVIYAIPVEPDHLGFYIRDVSLDEGRRTAATEEARYSAFVTKLIDASRDALVSIALDGRITFWNAAAERIFGFTRSEAVNEGLVDLLRPQSVTFPDMGTLIENDQWEGEIEMLTRDGRPIIVLARAQVMTNDTGTPEQIAVLYSDVTTQRRDEHRDRAQAQIADLALLASGVTHDLNSVFTPIVLGTQLLQQLLTDQNALALLHTVESSATRGLEMITRVLAVARGEHADRQQLAITDLMHEVAEYATVRLPDRIHVTVDLEDDDIAVLADHDQLLQVLVNLVNNAAEVMPGTGRITIQRRLSHAENRVEILVKDDGPGMDEHVLEQIFQPFFTTKSASWGTGLGLAASRSLAEQHDGTLTATSTPGAGSTFTLDLPISGRSAPRAQLNAATSTSSQDGKGRIVLLVEPDVQTLHTLRTGLETANYRVLAASDVPTATAWINEGSKPLLAIVSSKLEPGLRQLLHSATPDLPTLLTGAAPLQQAAGPRTALLTKPFNYVALLDAVAALTAGAGQP